MHLPLGQELQPETFSSVVAPPSFFPTILNVNNGECVHQRILLIYGRVGPANNSFESTVTVGNANFPSTTWQVFDTHFKCLVHLDPGQNDLKFTFNPPEDLSRNIPPATTTLQVYYLPLLQNPPLQLAILVSKDSKLVIDAPPEKQRRHENDLETVKARLRCAAYLWQAFTAEQMNRNGFGRRVFRLDEDWEPDTITNQDDSLRQTAKIHVVRTNYTLKELLDPERAQQYHPPPDTGTPLSTKKDLFGIFMDALRDYGPPFNKDCYVAGLILDTHYDPQMELIRGHAALGGGAGNIRLGIFGSHATHAWPRFLEEVASCFQDDTETDKKILANDAGESGTWWRCCNIGIGAMLHEVGHALTCPHSFSGIMSRGFNNLNRTFTVKEPHNHRPITQNDEAGAHWHRCDVVRFRYHPCFRLPSDEQKSREFEHMAPDFWPLNDSVLIRCPAKMSIIEIHVDGQYKYHLESTDNSREIELAVHLVKERVSWRHGQRIRLHVVAQNQSENTIENFESFLRDHRVTIPLIGTVLKSAEFGQGGGEKFEAIFQKAHCPQQMPYLCRIKVNAGDFLDGIKFYWSDGTTETHGGKGGIAHDFVLFEGEKIVALVVHSGAWIDGFEIRTDRGRKSRWFGGKGGSLHILEVPSGYEIVGMYGSYDSIINSLGIIYKSN